MSDVVGDGFTVREEVDGRGVVLVCDYCKLEFAGASKLELLAPKQIRFMKDMHSKSCQAGRLRSRLQ